MLTRVHAPSCVSRDPAAKRATERRAHVERRDVLTLRELGELFLKEHARALRRPRTAANYEILLRLHVYPRFGQKVAVELSRIDVGQMHVAMSATPSKANRVLAVMSSICAFASKRELIPEGFNPARGIEKFREEGRERYLTTDELQRLGTALIGG
jgi:hypothetical protein